MVFSRFAFLSHRNSDGEEKHAGPWIELYGLFLLLVPIKRFVSFQGPKTIARFLLATLYTLLPHILPATASFLRTRTKQVLPVPRKLLPNFTMRSSFGQKVICSTCITVMNILSLSHDLLIQSNIFFIELVYFS